MFLGIGSGWIILSVVLFCIMWDCFWCLRRLWRSFFGVSLLRWFL